MPAGAYAAAATAPVVSTQANSAAPAKRPLTARWLDLQTLAHSQRYRNAYNQGGLHLYEEGQERSLAAGRFKFDRNADYTIGFRASTGHYINWSYSDYAGESHVERVANKQILQATYTPAERMEIGKALQVDNAGVRVLGSVKSNGWQFYPRELFFSATPVKSVTLEFGSLGIERGQSTEITSFDEDAYIAGERLRLRDPRHLFFDQIGYTSAYFGDIPTPNFFERGSSLEHNNYRQWFVDKQLSSRIGFSGEYNWLTKTQTLREAAVVTTPETHVFDKVRVELYQRLNAVNLQGASVKEGAGFSAMAYKKVGRGLSGDFGFAAVDGNYSVYANSRLLRALGYSLNGDAYSQGKRVFVHASYAINPVVSAFGFYTHAVGARVLDFNQQGLNAGMNFDLKALVNTPKSVF